MGITQSVPGRGIFVREDAMKQLVAYLNENRLPEFQNMLRGMIIAGASDDDILDFIRKQLNEIHEKDGI